MAHCEKILKNHKFCLGCQGNGHDRTMKLGMLVDLDEVHRSYAYSKPLAAKMAEIESKNWISCEKIKV